MTKEKNNVITFSMNEEVTEQQIYDMLGFQFDGSSDLYYRQPYNYWKLHLASKGAALHETSLNFKTKFATSYFKTNEYLRKSEFKKFAYDFMVFGTAYLAINRSRLNDILSLSHLPSFYMRIGKEGGAYLVNPTNLAEPRHFKDVLILKNYDPTQTIYGMPDYLSVLPSVSLNTNATAFRIRYYRNGSHAGFILSVNGKIGDDLMGEIEKTLAQSKGDGNFKNLLINMPQGNKDSVQLIPIADIGAKDEFNTIKRATDRDINAGHRVPPIFMGIAPENAGGFGKPEEYAKTFYTNEMLPLFEELEDLNDDLGVEAFQFKEYDQPKEE